MVLGFICVAGAAAVLGILPSIQKQVMMDGLPLNSLIFFTNWTITLVCFLLSIIKKKSFKAAKVQMLQVIFMGVFGMLFTAVLLNSSYLYLPVGTTIMLNFLYSTIVCVIMGTVFKEGFTKLQVMAVAVSILGMFSQARAGKCRLPGL